MLALLTALALPACLQEGQGSQLVLPGQEPLAPALREELQRFDPRSDGWSTEVFASELGARWKALVGGVLEGNLAGLDPWLGEVRLGLEPELLEQGQGTWEWQRLRAGASPLAAPSVAVGLGGLLAGLGPDAGFKIKVVALAPEGEELRATVRVEVRGAGRAQQVVLEVEAVHPAALEAGAGLSAPTEVTLLSWSRVARLQREQGFEEVELATWLDPASAALLRPSTATLRRDLDTRLGVGLLGHHGVSAADLDLDGRVEVFVPGPGGVPNLLLVPDGQGRLVDRAPRLGLDLLDSTACGLFVDLDGDGLQEAILAVGSRVLVMTGRPFTLAQELPCDAVTSLAAGDADGDGDLDLFVCGYVSPYNGSGAPMPYHDAQNGAANHLLRNEGGLRFRDVTAEVGLDADNARFTFAATWLDADADGDQDLYVVNDFGSNQLWISEGGRFVERAEALGVRDVAAGMGASLGDVNEDGLEDLFVSNMFSSAGGRITTQPGFLGGEGGVLRQAMARHARGNSLFLRRSEGGFRELAGAGGAAMGRWAWGGRLVDLDLDGVLDITCPAGFVTGERLDDL
ncbi:MAG: VCBS repeat-containing protein [Planctomycetes bacterium]|nr:VCBS repeat-containing protein [Planctomycetota bacterium]